MPSCLSYLNTFFLLKMQNEVKLWKNTISCLETELSKATIGAFFADTELLSLEEGKAKILCPNGISADYLRNRYKTKIQDTLTTLTGKDYTVSFEVKKVTLPQDQDLGPIFKSSQNDGLVVSYNFDSFVVGFSNQLAVSVAKAVVEQPGSLHNPLFVHSGVGLGKTHLMHAVGNAIKERNPNAKVLYSPAESFGNALIKAIQTRRPTSSFRKKYRMVDVLLIDDIQFFAGHQSTQEEFFNTFNELHLANKQIVLASDRHPSEIKKLEQRLVSRFSGGMVADMQEPDLDMKIEILRRKAREKGATLKDEVLLQVAEQITGNIRQLEGVLNQILAISASQNLDPTEELVAGVIKNTPCPQKFISTEDIVQSVCDHFGIDLEIMRSKKRSQNIVLTRQVTAYLLRNLSQMSFKDIGEVLGGRDHTTVIHGVEKIEKNLKESPLLKNQINHLRVDILGKTS